MKRVLVVLLVVSLFTSIGVYAATSFSDVKSADWFKSDLDYILNDSRKILSGYPDGTYKPQGTLQVDQFIKCIIVAAGHEVTMTDGYWAQAYIDKAVEVGYIAETDFSDYSKGITRAEMASIVTKVMEDLETVSYDLLDDIEANLSDSNAVAAIHRNNVMKVYELGIITGYPDGTFKPDNTLTRAEATVVLRRIIDASARKPYTPVEDPYASHYKGGEDWVDPVTAGYELNDQIDKTLIESEELFFYTGESDDFSDLVGITIKYEEEGYPAVQIDDFKRLLSRRLNQDNVNNIIDYIDDKNGWYQFLPEKTKSFEYEGYIIEVRDMIVWDGKPYQASMSVEVQLWYK